MIPTNSQLSAIRSHPHLTKLYLSIYQPSTVLAARVNDSSSAKNNRLIGYDSVTAGSYLLIESGMTLYVGSAPGAFDKGMVRVRSATASMLTVAENSHINWADDDYLTVVSFFEINAVYPRIIQSPSDPMQTLWYKDYDIAYNNQNSVLGTFINMGPHHAGFVGEPVFYSASGTHNVLDDTLTYDWFFEGATVTGSSSHTPGNVTYTTPGHYTTRLTVSGVETGGSDTSYRHVSIYDHPGQGHTTPIQNWEFVSLSGSREQGGYTAKIRILETLPVFQLRDGSLVVIFAEDWYGDLSAKQSIGGNAIGRSSIVFNGYVMKGSIDYDYRDSKVEFDVGSPTEVMKRSDGFSVSVQFSPDPSTATNDPNIPSGWVTVLNMNLQRAIYHYLRWHSTVLMTNDFEFVGTDRYIQYFDTDRTSLYDAIHSFLKSAFVGKLVCDSQGKLWAERDIYIEQSAYPTTFPLSKQDWVGDVSLEESRVPQVSFIEIGGIAFDGSEYLPLLSNAPGETPAYRGSVERIQGLALLGQSELNTLAGNLYAQRNAVYPMLDFMAAGNYRVFDIAPQVKVPVTIESTDTRRGIAFTNKNFYINRIEYQYSSKTESLIVRPSLTEIATGFAGDTIVIPPVPPTDGYDIPTVTVPTIDVPFPTFDTGAGIGTMSTWVPITNAECNSVDRYPKAGEFGGILVDSDDDPVNITWDVAVPAGANVASVYLCFNNLGGGGYTATIDSQVSMYDSNDFSSVVTETDTTVYPIVSSSIRRRRTIPIQIDWTGNASVITMMASFELNFAGFPMIWITGLYIVWSAA